MVLLIDNYDSFTFNLAQYFGELGAPPLVRRNDEITIDEVDALVACFPAGTVSGAPKIRAMQILSELEPTRRDVYAGAVGYIDFAGNLDFCIAIRTITIRDGKARVQAGAGIVADSNPAAEYEETRDKARALLQALAMAEEGL